MRKWAASGLALLLVTAVGVWLVLRERGQADEPVYQGKRLSVWLEGYQLGRSQPEIDRAVRAIGSNGVPTLVRMLQAKDSPLWLRFLGFVQQSSIKLPYTPAETLKMRALAGFHALQSEARNAVPELIKAYTNNPGASPWGPAAALGEIGPDADEATGSLLLNAQNTNSGVREVAVSALANMHSHSEVVVPALIKAMHDPAPAVQFQAFRGLGRFGDEAKGAVPDLFQILTNDVRLDNRCNAAQALRRIANPEALVPILIGWLHDTNGYYRAAGASSLEGFGKDAESAIPALVQMLSDEDPWIRYVATGAVRSIDPDAAARAGVK